MTTAGLSVAVGPSKLPACTSVAQQLVCLLVAVSDLCVFSWGWVLLVSWCSTPIIPCQMATEHACHLTGAIIPRVVSLLLLTHSITQRHASAGSLAPLEDSQTALTNLGQALAQAPAIQLAPSYVLVPAEFLRSAVQDAFKYQVTQLGFADKVTAAWCLHMACGLAMHGQSASLSHVDCHLSPATCCVYHVACTPDNSCLPVLYQCFIVATHMAHAGCTCLSKQSCRCLTSCPKVMSADITK